MSDAGGANASAEVTLEVEGPSGLRITSLELDVATGAISGTPSEATGPNGEPVDVEVRVQDAVGASALARAELRIRPGPLVISDGIPDGQINVNYRWYLEAQGGFGERTWGVAVGALPPGLAIEHSGLWGPRIGGRPATTGSYTFTLRVSTTDQEGTREITIVINDTPLEIVTSTLPDGDVGSPYGVFLVREGGSGPFEWDIVSGGLPAGLSLTVEGELAGTPTVAGDHALEVRVRSAGGQSATQALSLHVDP